MHAFKETIINKWKRMSLQQKLTGLFIITAVTILAVNLYVYTFINHMTNRVEEVYVSNVRLNELTQALDKVQDSMEDYLNTKSSDAMEAYYRSDQGFRELLEELNTEVTDDELLLMEKNIYMLSESYLDVAAEVIQAKRGRNVEKYGNLYEEASVLHEEINTFIHSLNNEKFKNNSENYQILRNSLRYMEMLSIGVLLLVLLANVILILISTKMVTNPLHQLAQTANQVAKGDFDVEKVPIHSMDEVGIVTGAFNQMVESIRDHIEQLRLTLERENQLKERQLMMQSHLKDTQLKYLQAQINPHFLFNTLNAGVQLAMMEDAERTGVFLENMAEFFRYNVRKNDQDATLQEEIHLVDNYVHILNVRFSGEICFEKEVDEELLETRVPSMILQPIVENAVNYGIRGLDREGRILLDVYEKESTICISIWDNGIGIEKERIDQILSGEVREVNLQSNSNGVGLNNIMERLGLYFQGRAKLEIFSEGQDTGTEVLITIPKEEGENDVSDNVG